MTGMPRSDRPLAAIASAQHDVVTTVQLRAAGYTRHEIDGRVRRGQLTRLFRGVYFVGHASPSLCARGRAATLACGQGAVASHELAAALWGIGREPPPNAGGDITVVRSTASRAGIRVHRSATLEGDTRRRWGVPLTSPSRTISDLAATAPRDLVEHAVQEAAVRRLLTDRELSEVMERRAGHPGAPLLRAILGLESGPGFTRSAAERRLVRLIDAAGLPRPEKNLVVAGIRPDFVWPAERLIVEIDGVRGHDHGAGFARDRRRDQTLIAAGWRVVRFTAAQLRDEPLAVAAMLAAALAQVA